MKKFAKLLCLALACVLALSALAACGNGRQADREDHRYPAHRRGLRLRRRQRTSPSCSRRSTISSRKLWKTAPLRKSATNTSATARPRRSSRPSWTRTRTSFVATNAAFEPFEYKDGDSYYGVDMEIAKLLAEKLGKELVIQNMDFDAVLPVGRPAPERHRDGRSDRQRKSARSTSPSPRPTTRRRRSSSSPATTRASTTARPLRTWKRF